MNHRSVLFIAPLLLFTVLTLLSTPPVRAQLRLRDAIDAASVRHEGIAAARAQEEAASHGVSIAWGRLLPEVQVDVLYTHMDKDLVLDLDPIRSVMIHLQSGNASALANLESMLTQGRPLTAQERAAAASRAAGTLDASLPHFQEVLKERTFLQGAVTARQPIFAGGKILAGIRAARAQEDMAMARRLAVENDAVVETVTRYLGVLFARENLSVRRAALDAIEQHAQRATKLRESGVIARHDEQRAEVALAEARRDVLDATQKLRLAETALRSLLPDLGDNPVLADSLHPLAMGLSQDAWVGQCLRGNPSLRQLRSAHDAMREKGKASFGNYLPTVYGFGMVNLFDHYMIDKAEPKWAVGLGVSFTLFDGFRRSNEHQQIALEAEAVDASVRESERKLSLLVRSTEMNAALAAEQFQALEAAREQAEENIRLNARRFDEGLGTSLELIDAQLSWKAIMLKRAQAMHERAIAVLSLHALQGDAAAFLRDWTNDRQP